MLLWRRKGGQQTVFPWSECLSHTQDLSLSLVSLTLSSALAMTPECCVTFIGADDVLYDTFLPMWVPRLILLSHMSESHSFFLHFAALVYLLLFCFSHSHFSSFFLWLPDWFPWGQRSAAVVGRPWSSKQASNSWTDTHQFNLPLFNQCYTSRLVVHSYIWV